MAKTKAIAEFGDFQTPFGLAAASTSLLRDLGIRPHSILEPTCGKGTFLVAASLTFAEAKHFIGVEINQEYAVEAAIRLKASDSEVTREIRIGDFFAVDWKALFMGDRRDWLILGNPPWVTSSTLSAIGSENLPVKSNVHGHSGMEAVTGKSNFDISEWMILQYFEWLQGMGTVAVLCKASVARKVLLQVWKRKIGCRARIYRIDALQEFGAAVDACLFVVQLVPEETEAKCLVFDSLTDSKASGSIGLFQGHLVSNAGAVNRMSVLWGPEDEYSWRSGIKHDCSKVMELFRTSSGYYENGLGESVDIESDLLFPMLKGSDIGNSRVEPRAAMIVTQTAIGQETFPLERFTPRAWRYLTKHVEFFERRGSSIYRGKPSFSIFGVGPYTFAPWKVAICGLYKKLRFVVVGPIDGRPVVFDDTVSFLPCKSKTEAEFLSGLLHSELAQEFLLAMIHWSDKRPVTVDILKRLSLRKVAHALGRETEFDGFATENENVKGVERLLFAS